MKKIEEHCAEAAKLLVARGIFNAVVIAKCPDSNQLGMVHHGNKIWNMGACDMTRMIIAKGVIVMQEKRINLEDDDEDDDDPAEDWKKDQGQ